jgi:hypothetical protein
VCSCSGLYVIENKKMFMVYNYYRFAQCKYGNYIIINIDILSERFG